MGSYHEKRKCVDCFHTGLDDSSDHAATCMHCGAIQGIHCEDHCPTCGKSGFMGAACPICNGVYQLIPDDSTTSEEE